MCDHYVAGIRKRDVFAKAPCIVRQRGDCRAPERPVRKSKSAARGLLGSKNAAEFPSTEHRVDFDVEKTVWNPRNCIVGQETAEPCPDCCSGDHFDAC